MFKILSLILFTTLFIQKSSAQVQQYYLGKTWGFLKYFHPSSASGKIEMDSLLFDLLPRIQGADKNTFSSTILTAIENMGEIADKPIKTTINKNSFTNNIELSWLSDSTMFTGELISKLQYIFNNRHQGPGHYAVIQEHDKTFLPANEKLYKNSWDPYTKKEQRLLFAYRYWNIVEYYSPYKYLTDKKWDSVLMDAVADLETAVDTLSYAKAVSVLMNSLDDTHGFFYYTELLNEMSPLIFPVGFRCINDTLIVTEIYNDSLAKINDIRKGDVITQIDGKSITHFIENLFPYVAGSNRPAKIRTLTLSALLVTGKNIIANMKIIRDGREFSSDIRRYTYSQVKFRSPEPGDTVKVKRIPGNIIVANPPAMKFADVHRLMQEERSARAIIFDLRGYPKQLHATLTSYLTTKKTAFGQVIIHDFSQPGLYKWHDMSYTEPGKKAKLYKGKVYVLVNSITQSQGEFTAMALKACENVTVIGSQTSGADGVAWSIELPGNIIFSMTLAGFYAADKSVVQRKGIPIDIRVKTTIKGVMEGRDEILERAVLEAMK